MSVVTAHMVYFCAFTRSDIFPKNARKLGVGRGQFDAGVNGLGIFLNTVCPSCHSTFTNEGLRAKRAYIAFLADFFIFCRIKLIFGRLTCVDMKNIVP